MRTGEISIMIFKNEIPFIRFWFFFYFRAKWRNPTKTTLSNGIKVYTSGVPGGGDLLVFILNILDEFSFTKESIADIESTVLTFQKMIETFKYAYAFRTKLGDADYLDLSDVSWHLFFHAKWVL